MKTKEDLYIGKMVGSINNAFLYKGNALIFNSTGMERLVRQIIIDTKNDALNNDINICYYCGFMVEDTNEYIQNHGKHEICIKDEKEQLKIIEDEKRIAV